jgi:hypothetical protein
MRLKSSIVWLLILLTSFAIGYGIAYAIRRAGQQPVQTQAAPDGPVNQ